MQTCTPKGMLVCFTLVYTRCQFSVLKSKFNLDIPAIKRKMGLRFTLNFACRYPHLLWISKLRTKTPVFNRSHTKVNTMCPMISFPTNSVFCGKAVKTNTSIMNLTGLRHWTILKRAKVYVWSLISEKRINVLSSDSLFIVNPIKL